jgi:uncharacterized repeat protein (TIGR01451 family)
MATSKNILMNLFRKHTLLKLVLCLGVTAVLLGAFLFILPSLGSPVTGQSNPPPNFVIRDACDGNEVSGATSRTTNGLIIFEASGYFPTDLPFDPNVDPNVDPRAREIVNVWLNPFTCIKLFKSAKPFPGTTFSQEFSFGASGPGGEGTTVTLSNEMPESEVFGISNPSPGSFTVSEDRVRGWILTDLNCVGHEVDITPGFDPASGYPTAQFSLGEEDWVYCYFTNNQVTVDVNTLTVSIEGSGTGTVTSSPPGIDCRVSPCIGSFDRGTTVQLTTLPDSNSEFISWSGDPDCSDGVVTVDADKSCTATFGIVEQPSINIEKTPDLQTVASDGTVTFTITVTNNGNVTLTDVAVTDDLAPNCATNLGSLVPGISTTFTCTVTDVTADFTNSSTSTGTPPTGPDVSDTDTAEVSVLDHFECYRTPALNPEGATVLLKDQFTDPQEVEARVLNTNPLGRRLVLTFCNPVEKDGSTISDPNHHLMLYQIEATEAAATREVLIKNQFTPESGATIAVSRPNVLAVPTQKFPLDPPQGLDHFKCYRVDNGDSVNARVQLMDQFHNERENAQVLQPILFCNPAEKTIIQDTQPSLVTPIQDPEGHLVCYSITGTRNITEILTIENQFDREEWEFNRIAADLLCVPSQKG